MCIKEILIARIWEAISIDDNVEVSRLLEGAKQLQVLDESFIRLAGYEFDVKGTIYSASNTYEVLIGWQLLVKGAVPIDIYVEAFYILTLFSNLNNPAAENSIQADEENRISNTLEPVILELLRLCYWVHKCKETLDQASFAIKFSEFTQDLTFSDVKKFRENLHQMFREKGRALANQSISSQERLEAQRQLAKEVEFGPYRSNISSYLPEFMSAGLMKESGFEISFITTGEEGKRCDILVNSFKLEVKTFLDKTNPRFTLEPSLSTEILETLKKKKTIHDIEDSLSKRSDITLIFLSFTTLGNGFLKHTFNRNVDFSLQKALSESVSLAQNNRTNPHHMEHIPVIIFTTALDYSNCSYKMFFLAVSYPVKKKEDGCYEFDLDRLSIDLHF
jgi:hypothetical protein